MRLLSGYKTEGFFDEWFGDDGSPRGQVSRLTDYLNAMTDDEIRSRQRAAEQSLHQLGATFSVYGAEEGVEKIIPFDILPRLIAADEWERLERGLAQRITALNMFVADIYGEQKILKDGVVPKDLVLSSTGYLKQARGLKPPKGVWIHVSGIDLVRDRDGVFYVLEDNLRCPSGISYVLENRAVQKRTFPRAFEAMRVRPVSSYPDHLYETLRYAAPEGVDHPSVAVLTPGAFNSAYFEHAYLAQQMGVPLAEGSDLAVIDGRVMLRTTQGFRRVDVLYRRIDDEFLDPSVFRADSLLGVPGLMECYRNGTVTLVNAPGNGVADDKAVYAYVPQIVKYYLGEEALLPNVPTYVCADPKHLSYALANLDKLVVKATDLSGGSGMLIGPQASKAERDAFALQLKANPRGYIAQPAVALSRCPSLTDAGAEGRHVDFRPYILYGESVFVLPGGLTRVALTKGSLVVNSSRGGGSKDTWVLAK